MAGHLSIQVHGRVQGVGFRYATRKEASRLGLQGYVRNEEDGSVFIEAEGEESALETFLQWCHRGPPMARVDRVIVDRGVVRGYDSFSVRSF